MRVGENVGRAVAKDETRADRDAQGFRCDLVLAGEKMSAHDTGQRIAVGDPQSGEAEFMGAGDIFFRMRGPAQEGEVGGDG